MRKLAISFLSLLLIVGHLCVHAQAKKKKFSRNINMLGYDNFGPAISGDGNAMVYVSNYTNEGTLSFMYTKKINAASWKDPEELPRIINIPHLTYMHGYCLNFDGSAFYFTFKKSGGLGGYDIWIARREGNGWGAAQNLGSPLNSSLHDGSPSISTDGKNLYFMSCESMNNETASGCKIMVSTRSSVRSKWKAPTPLPDVINQGNTMSPNILADGETLMYISDHEGMPSWYMSRLEEGYWSKPEKMDFISYNSGRNISVAAKGRYLYHDIKAERGTNIEGLLIPEQYKPKDVLRVIGNVSSTASGTMKVYDVDSRERVLFQSMEAGDSYDFVLKEGHIYDASFDDSDNQTFASSKLFDLSEMRFSTRQKWNVSPTALTTGDSLQLAALVMDTTSLDIAERSVYELRRLVRFFSKAQGKYELSVLHYPLDTATFMELHESVDTMQDTGNPVDTVSVPDASALDMEPVNAEDSSRAIGSTVNTLPTLADKFALTLSKTLADKNITEEYTTVRGYTIPLKELEGNEDRAGQMRVYLKRVAD